MKPDPIIPSIEDRHNLKREQREQFLKREKLEPMFLNVNGKSKATPFKRGSRLDPALSFAPNLGGEFATGKAELANLVDHKLLKKVEDQWQAEGLAGFIAASDTAGGVTETIEYEPDEVFVRSKVEEGVGDRGVGKEGGETNGNSE